MITQDCITGFRAQLELSTLLSNSPYKWKRGTGANIGRLTFEKNSSQVRPWKLRIALLWLYTTFLILRIIYVVTATKISVKGLLEFLMWLNAYVGTIFVGLPLVTKQDEVCALVNQTFTLWRTQFPNKFNMKNSGVVYKLQIVLILAVTLIPIVLPLTFWLTPCAPQYLYSMISNNCSPNFKEDQLANESNSFETLIGIGKKIFLYAIEVYMITPLTDFGGLVSMVLLVTFAVSIGTLKDIQKSVPHVKRHYNSSSRSKTLAFKQAMLYRQIQLLISLCTQVFQDSMLPAMFIVHGAYNVMTLFAVLEFEVEGKSLAHLLGYLIFEVAGFDVIILECASRPVSLSNSVKGLWRRWQYFEHNPWLVKFTRASPTLKIKTKPGMPIERNRLAIFLRFCLQRSFFMVVYCGKMQ